MAKANKKPSKKASELFHNIIKASVNGQPVTPKPDLEKKKKNKQS